MARLYPNLAKKATTALLTTLAAVLSISPVVAAVPNDPGFKLQADFYNQINASTAWDVSTGSKKIVVAIIDTGIDSWHEDLRENLWINPHEIPDNNLDDDGNGYIDDINGWNFVEKNNNIRPSVFVNSDDKEAVRHGTIIAGLIGAKGGNNLDGTGVSQAVSIMTLRAIKSSGSGSLRAVNEAVNYAVENGADIISMSFVGDELETRLYESLRKAYEKGVLIVVAAGNYDSETADGNLDIKPSYPGCFDSNDGKGENWILTVGSVTVEDKLSDFSEYGKCIDILAPGEYLFSTERYSPQYGYPNQFGGPWFGTSFATPLVAGAAALIKSIHPEYTPKEIINALLSSADNIDVQNPARIGQLGSGRLNIGKSLLAASATPLKRLSSSFYSIQKNQLFKSTSAGGQAKRIAYLPEGTVLAFNPYLLYSKEEVAILMKNGASYRLHLYKSDGELIKSISIPALAIGDNNYINYSFGKYYIASSKYNSKTNKTTLNSYNTGTKKSIKTVVNSRPQNMASSPTGQLYYANISKNIVLIYGANGKAIPGNISGVIKVLDIKISETEIAILFERKDGIYLNVASLSNFSQNSRLISEQTKSGWHLKIASDGINTYFLPFNSSAGSFIAYYPNLSEALSVSLQGLSQNAR